MAEQKKNPVFILRFDGEDLKEFFRSAEFEPKMVNTFTQIESSGRSLRKCVITALNQLTVDHGLPPPSDPWVFNNIVDPALQILSLPELEESPSEEIFMEKFRKFIREIIIRLHDQPIIVAHTVKTYDGSGIRRLLSNNFELKKLLDLVWRELSNGSNLIAAGEILRVAFDRMATPADLPCYGTVDQVDSIVNEEFGVGEEEVVLQQEQFKETMIDRLGSLVLRLESNPISISSNSVVHEPFESPSTVVELME